jgi:DNA primase small subunit
MTSNEYEAVAAAADFNPQLLHTYYHKLFPADLIAQWTTHNLDKREWSYTLDNDIYVRFQAFSTPQLLKEDIRRKLPHKIDIGAVYNARPTMKTAVGKFVPVQREFVFDIDLTDYSDVRACCEGASACDKCWTLMKAAMKVIDTALREDFDFQHILWVYSGRRGIHCWVCDQHVSKFDNEQRAKLVDYFTVFQGNEHSAVKVSPDAINHPAVRRAYELLKPIFEKEWISDQNILTRKEGLNQLLGLIQFNGKLGTLKAFVLICVLCRIKKRGDFQNRTKA